MSEENGMNETLELIDLGDAKEEIKHCSPLPLYVDNIWGFGSENFPQC